MGWVHLDAPVIFISRESETELIYLLLSYTECIKYFNVKVFFFHITVTSVTAMSVTKSRASRFNSLKAMHL